MPRNIFTIENGKFGLSLTDPGDPADTATIADYSDFSCQVTAGALNASANVTDNTVPATFCEPESTTPLVGATTYELAVSILQDPQIMAGLSRFLYEHDTEVAYFFLGLDGDNPPKAVGKVRVVAGTFGGEARVTLTADVTMPCDGKPSIAFGDSGGSVVIGPVKFATGATAGTPGSWTPAGSTPPASPAALIAGTPNVVVASPTTAWTVGQYVQTATAGTGGRAHWSGTAWVSGAAT